MTISPEAFGEELGALVKFAIAKSLVPIESRLAAIEGRLADLEARVAASEAARGTDGSN